MYVCSERCEALVLMMDPTVQITPTGDLISWWEGPATHVFHGPCTVIDARDQTHGTVLAAWRDDTSPTLGHLRWVPPDELRLDLRRKEIRDLVADRVLHVSSSSCAFWRSMNPNEDGSDADLWPEANYLSVGEEPPRSWTDAVDDPNAEPVPDLALLDPSAADFKLETYRAFAVVVRHEMRKAAEAMEEES